MNFDAHGKQRAGNGRTAVDNNGDSDTIDPGEEALTAWQPLSYFSEQRTRTEGTWQGYAGHETYNSVGIVHMKGRIYDPTLGRFLQPDPIVEDDLNPQTWNRYTYVRNNPMTFTDPTGYATHKEEMDAKTAKFDEGMATIEGSITVTVNHGGTLTAHLSGGGTITVGKDVSKATPEGASPGTTSNSPEPRARLGDSNPEYAKRAEQIGEGVSVAGDVVAVLAPEVPILKAVSMFTLASKLDKLADAVSTGTQGKKALQGAEELAKNAAHANKVDARPATLYEKYDRDGNFLKHGITKHEDPAKRYTKAQINGGEVVRTNRGPRNEIIKTERDLVERNPGPDNREPWAGKRKGQ